MVELQLLQLLQLLLRLLRGLLLGELVRLVVLRVRLVGRGRPADPVARRRPVRRVRLAHLLLLVLLRGRHARPLRHAGCPGTRGRRR